VRDEHETCELLCLDLPKAEALRASLPSSDDLEAVARPFKALTDPTRLALVLALADQRDGPMVMYDLTDLGVALVRSCRASGAMA
jgi:hypothetical protein